MRDREALLDLGRIRVRPLAERKSLSRVDEILADPGAAPPPADPEAFRTIEQCAEQVVRARERGASVILAYGAHLLRNGAARIMERMMEGGWLTHLATSGAGTIHDWEYAWQGCSTESVRENVADGTFGAWEETGRCHHLALMAGALEGMGYGGSLGRFIMEEELFLPGSAQLEGWIRSDPLHPLAAARADLLQAIGRHSLPAGRLKVPHPWKHASPLAQAWRLGLPFSVHPGIGYDIVSCHPMFSGSVIGRAADTDFRLLGAAVEGLEGGVAISVGSAVMAPQVLEKSMSCVNNLRRQEGRPPVSGHHIFVVDLQRGGQRDWSRGEPPRDSPDYYLRFCKSLSRLGAPMRYARCDNLAFLHHLWRLLSRA